VHLKENPSDGHRLLRTQLARDDPNTMPQGTSDEAHYLDILVMRLAKLELLVSRIKMIGIFWEHAEGLLPPLSVDRKSTAGEGWSLSSLTDQLRNWRLCQLTLPLGFNSPNGQIATAELTGRQRRRSNGQFSCQGVF